MESGYTLKLLTTGFANKLAKRHERKVKNTTEVLGLSNWKNGVAINRNGEGNRKSRLGGEIGSFSV